jgi:hypothetical protein
MSRRSAASRQPSPERSGGIDRLCPGQNAAPADIVAAGLDLLAIDEIDGAREQGFQRRLEVEEAREVAPLWPELDQEINVARHRVEIPAPAAEPKP